MNIPVIRDLLLLCILICKVTSQQENANQGTPHVQSNAKNDSAKISVTCPESCRCNDTSGGIVVDCQNVNAIPDYFPSESTMINIEGSTIEEIPPFAFSGLTFLQFISVHHSRIATISACALSFIKNINSITIYNNTIGLIQNGAFTNLENANSLEIYGCDIGTIDSFAFSSVRNVSIVTLKDNNIVNISSRAFSDFNHLSSFSIENSNITKIAGYSFTNITDVDNFYISGSNVSLIETHSIYQISSVRILSITGCTIKEFKAHALAETRDVNSIMMYSNVIENFECGNTDAFKLVLQGASFHMNAMRCDCDIVWLLRELPSLPPLAAVYMNRCYEPIDTVELPFELLTEENICESAKGDHSQCGADVEQIPDVTPMCGYVCSDCETSTQQSTTEFSQQPGSANKQSSPTFVLVFLWSLVRLVNV